MAVEGIGRTGWDAGADECVGFRLAGPPPDAEGPTTGELAARHRVLLTGGFTAPALALPPEPSSAAFRPDAHGPVFAPHGRTSVTTPSSRTDSHTGRGPPGRGIILAAPGRRTGAPFSPGDG
ncbi:hypothetical protein [Streptomyces griseus]|uniref:hypothetical protein n=1 Tax=Streptomyces griseus TaxID=1911 RepID=UPI0004CA4AB6|nr:hypothetical protein [Streptomyces griseus]